MMYSKNSQMLLKYSVVNIQNNNYFYDKDI
jgi:hypothetical protein